MQHCSVAIISGRELNDLRQRISSRVAYLVGNHGNQGLDAIPIDAEACAKICAQWTKQLQALPEFQIPGVSIEQKGYTLSVHYRLAKHHTTTQKRSWPEPLSG